MATYTGKSRIEISFNPASDRHFYAAQALLSQFILEVEDRALVKDEEDRRETMAAAIDEWSAAVRHGFVCC